MKDFFVDANQKNRVKEISPQTAIKKAQKIHWLEAGENERKNIENIMAVFRVIDEKMCNYGV